MSKVALLCPGPSLRDHWCEDFFDEYQVVVAVNTAGWLFRHHWLCFLDSHVWTPIREGRAGYFRPLVGIRSNNAFCDEARRLGLAAEAPPQYYGVGVTAEMRTRTGNDRSQFTMPNALHFCLTRFPLCSVDIYGMDYAIDRPDAAQDKYSPLQRKQGDRSLKRFRKEALWLREVWDDERINVFGQASQELRDYVAGRREVWI